ncbi:pseudouridylate synthase, putative [Plasmodium chabaudi chabaudi]|uniref:Pseudouridylate synthase, putative n=1 Tax=Plasmodium chabaudi chabaudi TaxID=31271 RepID=A0A1D3RU06_PLACU|nr:pseudouridylate synthase, putative [Plasmodium chabaudi chabaudi]
MRFFSLLLIIIFILVKICQSFKIMKIVVDKTSGLNVVDKKFKPKYFIKNKLRFVSPYVYTYKLFSKKRWFGKNIVDVLASEFCAYNTDYFLESIKKGYIKVNNKNITNDYIIKSNDFIEHKLLLFEKPVLYNKIIILYEDENFICVNKVASMPTHPVGSYQYNSLLRILQNYISQSGKNETENKNDNETDDVVKIDLNLKKNNFHVLDTIYTHWKESKEKSKFKSRQILNSDNHDEINEGNSEKRKKKRKNYNNGQSYLNDSGNFNKKLATNHNENKTELTNVTSESALLNNEVGTNLESNILTNEKIVPLESSECSTNLCNNKKFIKEEDKEMDGKPNKSEQNEKDDSYIYTLHRLDKLTSGIVLFGKNKKFSTLFSEYVCNNKITKSYITRVEGDFRNLIKKLINENKILQGDNNNFNEDDEINNLYEEYCNNNGIKNNDIYQFNGDPVGSFKNDIFLYRNKYKKNDDKNVDNKETDLKNLINSIKKNNKYAEDIFDMSKFEDDQNIKQMDDDFEMYHKYFVIDFGYMYCEDKKLLKYVFTKYNKENYQIANQYSIKPSVTKFMFLSYNNQLNESLLLCQPMTGRTHQIRTHLKSLSFPISNDSHYNPNVEKEYMTKTEKLHFENQPNEESKNIEKYSYYPLVPFLNTSFNWLYDDTINLNNIDNEENLNNYFFKNLNNSTYHSSGIFLHSFRYTWDQVFDIFTLLPKWCNLFYIPKSLFIFLLYGCLSTPSKIC